MKFGRVSLGAGIVAMILASATAMGADGAYPIKIERPKKAGDTYDVHIVASKSMGQKVSANGEVVDNQTVGASIDLTGREKISAVDDHGDESKLTLVIEKCVDADGKELLPKGEEVSIEISETAVSFKGKDGPVGRKAKEALDVVYTPSRAKKKSDDEMFGTKEPKKVGDSWDMNVKAMLEDLGLEIDPKNGSGSITLKGVEKSGDIECLKIAGAATFSKIPVPGLPPGFEVKESVMKVTLEGLLPTDAALVSPSHSLSAEVKVAAGGEAEGKQVEFSMTAIQKKTETRKLVK